mmetsp:Transcript_37014/g.81326  ORF Transcript_37014/g.81326 Transcript_37014/m.81326 type:complete len:200 (-) Transcript_37014:165-764(-)
MGRVHFSISATACLLFAGVSLEWSDRSLTYFPIPLDLREPRTVSSTSKREIERSKVVRTCRLTREPSSIGLSQAASVVNMPRSIIASCRWRFWSAVFTSASMATLCTAGCGGFALQLSLSLSAASSILRCRSWTSSRIISRERATPPRRPFMPLRMRSKSPAPPSSMASGPPSSSDSSPPSPSSPSSPLPAACFRRTRR